jgi:hypothetical protein
MRRLWRHYVLQTQAGEGGDAGGGGAAGSQGGQGQQGGQGGGSTDLNAFYKEAYKEGKTAALNDIAKDLQTRFGVTKLEDLEKIIQEKLKSPNPDHVKVVEGYEVRVKDLESQLVSQRLQFNVQSALAPLKPHDPSLSSEKFLRTFDVKDDGTGNLVVYKKGSSTPEFLNQKPATVGEFVQTLLKSPEWAWHFEGGASGGSSITGGQKRSKFTVDDLKNQKFVKALQDTGEYFNFVNGKPEFNEEKVMAFMQKNA